MRLWNRDTQVFAVVLAAAVVIGLSYTLVLPHLAGNVPPRLHRSPIRPVAPIGATPAVAPSASATTLAQTAAEKRAEATKALLAQWAALAPSVPDRIEALRVRATTLSQLPRRPNGIDLASADRALYDAGQLWEKANTLAMSEDYEEAVKVGDEARAKAEVASEALKQESPAAAAAKVQKEK